MLADIAGGNDSLGLADVVVLDENDLEQIADVLVVVDDGADAVNQVNNGFSHPVARGGLPAEDGDSRGQLLALFGGERFDGDVSVDDTEDVHLLTLVLVYALNLDIEECVWVHDNAGCILDMSSKSNLVREFNLSPLLLEFLVVHKLLKLVQQS